MRRLPITVPSGRLTNEPSAVSGVTCATPRIMSVYPTTETRIVASATCRLAMKVRMESLLHHEPEVLGDWAQCGCWEERERAYHQNGGRQHEAEGYILDTESARRLRRRPF